MASVFTLLVLAALPFILVGTIVYCAVQNELQYRADEAYKLARSKRA